MQLKNILQIPMNNISKNAVSLLCHDIVGLIAQHNINTLFASEFIPVYSGIIFAYLSLTFKPILKRTAIHMTILVL